MTLIMNDHPLGVLITTEFILTQQVLREQKYSNLLLELDIFFYSLNNPIPCIYNNI